MNKEQKELIKKQIFEINFILGAIVLVLIILVLFNFYLFLVVAVITLIPSHFIRMRKEELKFKLAGEEK
jgi:hypothetical protein